MRSPDELRNLLVSKREELLSRSLDQVTGKSLLEEHTILIDEVLKGIHDFAWQQALESQSSHFHPDRTQLTIAATGGYGRAELSPHSDIDIAFIPSEEDNPFLDAVTKEAFRLVVELFLDSTDLQVGYAYRPIEDLQHLDHQTVASLLDARFIAGSERLFDTFMSELFTHVNILGFVQEKINERERIVRRGVASVYEIEPNLKDGPGGLRDVHSARWLAQAMYRCGESEAIPELVRRNIVAADDCMRVQDALEFLWRTRNALHLIAGKKEDRLIGEHVDEIAEAFGYQGEDEPALLSPNQQLLFDLYKHEEHTHRFFDKVSQRLLDTSLPLDTNFRAIRHRIRLVNPAWIRERPGLLLRAFEYAQRYNLRIDSEVEAMIRETLPVSDDWLQWSEARTSFLSILRSGIDLSATLQQMHDLGVLGKVIPEFDALMYLAPSDPSHELTVGAHSLRALDLLCSIGETDDRGPLRDAFDEVTDHELLILATLLHDLGKLKPDGDHARSGVLIARQVASRLRLEESRIATLEKLVRHHLLLVRTSRLHDIDLPETIRRITSEIGDKDTLRMLYILSHVDTRAVGDHAYTLLDLQLLDELYLKALTSITDDSGEYDTETLAATHRDRVTRELQSLHLSEETVRDLCARLPAPYVINTPLSAIAHHLTLLDRLAQERVITDFYQPPRSDHTELTVCAYDDPTPGLLSKICGTVYASDIDIRHARVNTIDAKDPIVLDTISIMKERRPLTARQMQRLGDELRGILLNECDVVELIRRAGKPIRATLQVERLDMVNNLSVEHTVIHVVVADLQGLLYFLSHAIARIGLDIHSAKIASWAGMAEDAFYVSRRDGSKVADDELELTSGRLIEILTQREEDGAANAAAMQ